MAIDTFIQQHIPGYSNREVVLPFDVEERIFQANEIVTDYGQVERRMLLLEEGVVQVSTVKDDREHILEFVFPGNFFGAYTSFLRQEPSDVQVMTLSKCKVSIVRHDDLLRENQVSLISSHLSLHIAQQLFLSRAEREKDFLKKIARSSSSSREIRSPGIWGFNPRA
jgi:CRP-like cAMP-binding protein